MEDAVRSMTCLLVDPHLHGVLIKGPAGSGKSAIIHSFSAALTGKRAKVIPQNITDEQLFGTIDLEEVLSTGNMAFEPGILGGDDPIILVDDINLLPKNTSLTLMDSVHRGSVHVEREGVSMTYPCSVSVVATVNDREQPLSSAVMDLFDICVVLPRDSNRTERVEIMQAVLSEGGFEDIQNKDLVAKIEKGRSLIDSVFVPDMVLKAIVDAGKKYGLHGVRGELSATRVCKASAALDGRTMVNEDDLAFALKVCIPHRRTRHSIVTKEPDDHVMLFNTHEEKEQEREVEAQVLSLKEAMEADVDLEYDQNADDKRPDDEEDEFLILDMEKVFETIDLLDDSRRKRSNVDTQLMRRYIKDVGKDGRYVSSKPADNDLTDLAIDATVRYAAPYQKRRRENSGKDGVIILPSDLRQKIREKRTSCLYFFMVDNSGSLVLRSRMRAVKAAILSMLGDHYTRRDSVAIMTFNQDFIGMLQPPTRSVGGIQKIIEDIPVGMKTPLSEALSFMHTYVGQYLRKHPGDMAFVVLMTDAGANVAMTPGNDPLEESLQIASHLRLERMECVVVDIKVSSVINEKAKRLARALDAPYYKIEDLRSSNDILN